MKNVLLIALIGLSCLSCSLMQRSEEIEEPSEAEGGEALTPVLEAEVARLNTKIAALETKMEVLTNNLEKTQIQNDQPIIEAEPLPPESNLAAPMDFEAESNPIVSAAPIRASEMAPAPNSSPTPIASAQVEKDFRRSMGLFQNGQNPEAASAFATLAKKYPQHLLASHALYWAGESAARAQQWSTALQNWEELEKRYPRSAYLPEALAGLARAHDNQGNTAKAQGYRNTLVRAFPKAPVTLSFRSSPAPASTREGEDTNAPVYEESSDEAETE